MNKLSICLSALLLGLTLIWGCGTEEPTDTEEQPLPTVEFKNKDNTVYSRLAGEPDRLNPYLTTNGYARNIWELVYYPLIDIDRESLELVPVLATSRPEITELPAGHEYAGGVSYTFELNPAARWDDGSAITAADVLFTYKVLMNPNVNADAQRSVFQAIKDVQVDPNDPLKFTVFANEKYILGEEAVGTLNVLPTYVLDPENSLSDISVKDIIAGTTSDAEKEVLQAFADQFHSTEVSRAKDMVVGSGPYRFEKWEAGQYISMSRKKDWWGDDQVEQFPALKAFPDSLVFRIVTDQTTVVTALKDELLDVAYQIDARAFDEMQENEFIQDHFNLHTPDASIYYFIAFNMKDPLLEDRRVRRALAHLLDLDVIIEKVQSGLGTRLTTSVLPSKKYHDDDLPLINLDIDKAIALLKEAGWEDTNGNGTVDKEINGQTTELVLEYLTTPGSVMGQSIAELLKGNGAQAGVEVNVNAVEARTMMSDYVRPRKFQMYAAGFGSDPLLDDFTQIWHTESNTFTGFNRTQFGNAETDALIEKIRVTLDEEERNAMYREFQEILYEEQPMIFLFSPKERIAISKRFRAKSSVVRPGYDVRAFDHIAK